MLNNKAYFELIEHLNVENDVEGLFLLGCMVQGAYPPEGLGQRPGAPRYPAHQICETGLRNGVNGVGPLDMGPPLVWLAERGLIDCQTANEAFAATAEVSE